MNMTQEPHEEAIIRNYIIADAEWLDRWALELTVRLERARERRVPPADMGRWAMAAAIDGGLRQRDGLTQVVLVHEAANTRMENFAPAVYATGLTGQACRDGNLGEFVFTSVETSDMADKQTLLADIVRHAAAQEDTRRIVVAADPEKKEDDTRLLTALREADEAGPRLTLLDLKETEGLRHKLLANSILFALGLE